MVRRRPTDLEIESMSDKRQESIDLLNNTHRFPQPVTVKVIGKNTEQFKRSVMDAIANALGLDGPPETSTRETKGGRHIAITAEPTFESAEQVLDLYAVLQAIPDVVMML